MESVLLYAENWTIVEEGVRGPWHSSACMTSVHLDGNLRQASRSYVANCKRLRCIPLFRTPGTEVVVLADLDAVREERYIDRAAVLNRWTRVEQLGYCWRRKNRSR